MPKQKYRCAWDGCTATIRAYPKKRKICDHHVPGEEDSAPSATKRRTRSNQQRTSEDLSNNEFRRSLGAQGKVRTLKDPFETCRECGRIVIRRHINDATEAHEVWQQVKKIQSSSTSAIFFTRPWPERKGVRTFEDLLSGVKAATAAARTRPTRKTQEKNPKRTEERKWGANKLVGYETILTPQEWGTYIQTVPFLRYFYPHEENDGDVPTAGFTGYGSGNATKSLAPAHSCKNYSRLIACRRGICVCT